MSRTSRKQFENKLIEKAWKDPSFLSRLRKDAKAAYEAELRKEAGGAAQIPSGVSVRVIEEGPNTVTVVIPWNPNSAENQRLATKTLPEIELVAVAGGMAGDKTAWYGDTSTCNWYCSSKTSLDFC